MRLTVLLLFVSFIQVRAVTMAHRITIDQGNAPLGSMLKEIRQQSGYDLFHDGNLVSRSPKVMANLSNAPVAQALASYNVLHHELEKTKSENISIQPIEGVVRDSLGRALAGVSVVNRSRGGSTSTDISGRFRLEAEFGDTLVLSSMGYLRQELRLGQQTQLDIVLLAEQAQLEAIVVTALGIKQSVKALTYNVQEFKAEEITRNKDANFVNSLTGKIAGVTINSSSSGIGGATRVVMRGTKSIAGNNNALYVVDGIPIPNTNAGAANGPFEGVVSGEGISSFNPEDIESITALTGPSATALYGNQGANGVLLVNTKKGTSGKIKVSLSHSSDFFSPFVMPRFQNTYGQANPQEYASWGARLPQASNYSPREFFQTGFNVFNSASISGGTERSQTLFSAGANNAEGLIRNNTFNRYNFYLRHNSQLTDRLTADFSAMYVRLDDNNMVAQGQYQNPIVPVYLFPPGDDFRKYRVFSRYDPNRLISTQFWPYQDQGLGMQNPYWISDAQTRVNTIDRYMMSATANYKLSSWLNITGRVRIDNSIAHNETKRPAGTWGLFASEFGYYLTGKTSSKNTYLDLIASAQHQFSDRFSLRANVGASYQDDLVDGLGAGGNLLRLANFYSVEENTDNPATQNYSRTQLQSTFATTQFGYENWLFMDLTGRYEWPSQLPKEFATSSSYFYPSIGVSGVISDKWNISKEAISFAKVRFSYAEVGNPPRFGIANPVFSLVDDSFRPAPFADYRPERTRSYEAGIELRFLQDRLTLNATAYQSNTTNQLLEQPLLGSSIYTVFFYNAGDIRNRGIEASLSHHGKFNQLDWTSGLVFSLNRNRVMRLSDGFINPATSEPYENEQRLVGGLGDFQNVLTVGGTMADFYISQVLREDNQGNLWVNPMDRSIAQVTIPRRYVGSAMPDFNLGWNNQFSYKGVDLSFLIDARVGGIGVSYTQSMMDAFGVSEQSALDRDNGGVMVYGSLYPDVQGYYNTLGLGTSGMAGYYIYSATNVRLREVALGYNLPTAWFDDKGPAIRLSLTGRNLFMFYNKSPFDPESTSSTGTYDQGVDYFRQPSYRSLGFSIRAQF
ncbi:SusC/RagA family TonB-linked outer membrane protein [Sphingobacterium paludis]|nr:SusC/RagA family TonB-linked outer membrane protein [Sphingobacterium paludis]